jgi:hypothetical protein
MSKNRNQRRGDKHVSKVVRGEQQIMADRKIKEKFVEQRKNKPLVPMNEIQKYYFECLRDMSRHLRMYRRRKSQQEQRKKNRIEN